MSEVYITSAVRTPIGKYRGGLSGFPSPKLGELVVGEAIRRSKAPIEAVDEVMMGCVLQSGLGQNPARQAALGAGVPVTVGAATLNMVCGSGLKAILLGAQAIRAGDADVFVGGGMESMSRAPKLDDGTITMVHDGLTDVFNDIHMGETCERVAERFKVTREEMDSFAAESHQRALAARFEKEIIPVETVRKDEGPRKDSTLEKLATLKPVFRKDGLVTAGNSSQLSDGAAAVVLMSEKAMREHGAKPLARVTGVATAGVEPEWVLVSTIDGLRAFDARNPWKAGEADLVEINEAFAASTVAVIRELGLDPGKVNVNGGAVALGHPIGCSGTRIVVTLLHALEDRGLRRGVATLCMGGGNGLAIGMETL